MARRYETPERALDRFPIGITSLYKALREGKIEGARKLGGKWMIPVDAEITDGPGSASSTTTGRRRRRTIPRSLQHMDLPPGWQ